jgi:hypothetical protein
MNNALSVIILLILTCTCGCRNSPKNNTEQTGNMSKKYHTDIPGNKIVECVRDTNNPKWFIDPVDDTVNYKKVIDNIYKDKKGNVYLRTAFPPDAEKQSDTFLMTEYFKDIGYFFDLKSYKYIKDGYFTTNGKVYMWWSNDAGEYPEEIPCADPVTFVPFDSVAGGKDKNHAYFGGPPDDFVIIKGADPKTLRVLNPKNGCWNGGNCYFIDKHSVFCGLKKIKDADPATFKLVDMDSVDAADRYRKYFEGRVVGKF